ncbi:MAG: PilZ domain-containing protein [Myxococcota bacterium]
MTYSGAAQARQARESLGKALEALQKDSNIPDDVMAVAQNIAQSVGALFEAEKASSEPDGKSSVKAALGSLSQTLALLQDVRTQHNGIALATEVIAQSMSSLYPLTTTPTKPPGTMKAVDPETTVRSGPPGGMTEQPKPESVRPRSIRPEPPKGDGPREDVEANIGATTESNFYVGFSGEISEGGVFLATYEVLAPQSRVSLLVTLPGNFEFRANGWVRFVRDPFDLSQEGTEPGMGIQFEALDNKARELVLRFVRKRAPMFYDD